MDEGRRSVRRSQLASTADERLPVRTSTWVVRRAGCDVSGPGPGAGTGLDAQLEQLGFRLVGTTRRGRTWALAYNHYLRFALHEDVGDDRLLLSWSFAWGDYVTARGWQLSITDETTAELYPANDVVVPADGAAVRGEVLRVLSTLRIDLGAPEL